MDASERQNCVVRADRGLKKNKLQKLSKNHLFYPSNTWFHRKSCHFFEKSSLLKTFPYLLLSLLSFNLP